MKFQIWNNTKTVDISNENELDKAYKLVYNDLCKMHSHVMALHNGTLHKDDIFPTQIQVSEMIQYIVNRGRGNYKNRR